MGGGLSRKRLQEELTTAQSHAQAEALAAKDRDLRAKDKVVKQLRRKVRELISADAASKSALQSAEAKQAVAEAAAFASTCTEAEKASQIQQLQEELSSAKRAARQLETELECLTAEVSRIKSELQVKDAELCRTQGMLREARAAVEGGKSMAQRALEEADGKVRRVQEIHSNVSFLRAKLVSMYLGEVLPERICENHAQHYRQLACPASLFHAELDARVRPDMCLSSGVEAVRTQSAYVGARCRGAWS